jgi:hypothetical protein
MRILSVPQHAQTFCVQVRQPDAPPPVHQVGRPPRPLGLVDGHGHGRGQSELLPRLVLDPLHPLPGDGRAVRLPQGVVARDVPVGAAEGAGQEDVRLAVGQAGRREGLFDGDRLAGEIARAQPGQGAAVAGRPLTE